MQKEVWKPLVVFEGGYEVSSFGRLRSIERIVDYGWKKAKRPSKILSLRCGKWGYLYTTLSLNKVRKTLKIHRMVATTFIDNPENKPQVNHIDGDKSNNNISNLEWCTAKENVNHAYYKGLRKGIKGERSHLSKLTKKQVAEIREIYSKKQLSQEKIGKKYNIAQTQVSRIVNYVNW